MTPTQIKIKSRRAKRRSKTKAWRDRAGKTKPLTIQVFGIDTGSVSFSRSGILIVKGSGFYEVEYER